MIHSMSHCAQACHRASAKASQSELTNSQHGIREQVQSRSQAQAHVCVCVCV